MFNISQHGAVSASGKKLSQALIIDIDFNQTLNLLEIGAGNGAITHHIIKNLNTDSTLTIVEIDEKLVDILRLKFSNYPNINIIHGDFLKISDNAQFDHIISSIPYNIFTKEMNQSFFNKKESILKNAGTIRFFEYLFFRRFKKGFNAERMRISNHSCKNIILLNYPPAEVYIYKKIN